jgi:hypothetical protein
MPYVAFQNGNYEGFSDPVQSLDVGMNYFVNGHNAKFYYQRFKRRYYGYFSNTFANARFLVGIMW